MTTKEIIADFREDLMKKTNVRAVGRGYRKTGGITTNEEAVICSVEKKVDPSKLSSEELIPSMIRGVKTDVQEVGHVEASVDLIPKYYRPAYGGMSVGYEHDTTGTFGCVVERDGKQYILSNNHVLAYNNYGSKGDKIIQPSLTDGGRLGEHEIAVLEDYVPIKFNSDAFAENGSGFFGKVSKWFKNLFRGILGRKKREEATQTIDDAPKNLVDCAIARPLLKSDIEAGRIKEIGDIQGTAEPQLGMTVYKSGRSSGLTKGMVEQLDVTIQVTVGFGKTAVFEDQIIMSPMSEPGDSGSAIVDKNNNVVALLFAGSDQVTVANRIQNVENELGVQVVTK